MIERADSENARLLSQLSDLEPRPEVVQRALERTRKSLANCQVAESYLTQEPRKRRAIPIGRTVAAIAIVLVAAVGAYFLFFADAGAENAFAQVQSAIDQVHCVAFEVEVLKTPKDVVTEPGSQVVDLSGNRCRFESADGTEISVIDSKRGTWMQLYPAQRRAVIVQIPSTKQLPSFADFLKRLRDCDADTVERIRDGELEGQAVERYRVLPESPLSGGVEMLVSVDPTTHLPVQIDSTTDKLGGQLHVVCKDFSFDQREPSLFSIVPPEDYQVERYPVSEPQVVPSTTVDLGRPKLNIEIRLAEKASAEGLIESSLPGDPAQKIYLHPEPIVTEKQIQNCRLSESGREIELTFTDEGSARMVEATSEDVPKQLAVLIEGRMISAPVVHSTISNRAAITGDFPHDLMQRLSAAADGQ